MPWTVAHAAAALPLRSLARGRLSLAALVVGSMTPDFGYYAGGFPAAGFAHTPLGLVVVCLPAGFIALWIVDRLREPIRQLLPEPHRSALAMLPHIELFESLSSAANVALSLLLGALSHIVWDSFTHADGWVVAMLPVLRSPVSWWPGKSVALFHVFQHASTALGSAVLAIAYVKWLSSVSPRPGVTHRQENAERWRYVLLGAMLVVAATTAVPLAYAQSFSRAGVFQPQVFAFHSAVFATTTFVAMLTVSALLVAWRRARATIQR